jgi:O-glycosyl hydrolase
MKLRCHQFGTVFLFLLSAPSLLCQPSPKTILIQPQIQQQRIDGFGFSIALGTARQIQALPDSEKKRLLDLLFGAAAAHCNLVRTEVSPFGKRLTMTSPLYVSGFVYSFAEDENESAQFSFLREARKRGDILVNLCPWSPPAQWKTNNSLQNGGSLREDKYQDYADYLFNYLKFYMNLRNFAFQSISLQYAPDQALPYQSCVWRPEQLASFLKVFSTTLKKNDIPLQILLPEVGWDRLAEQTQPFLKEPGNRETPFTLSAHSTSGSIEDRTAAREMIRRTNLKIWQTNFAVPARMPEWAGGLALAQQFLEDLTQAECNAWLYGTVTSNPLEPDKAGLVELEKNTFKTTKRFWAFSQVSRFVGRDYVRVYAVGGSSLYAAFRNPLYKELSIVFVNPSLQEITEPLEMRGWSFDAPHLYRTSEGEDCQLLPASLPSGPHLVITLAPKSVTTLVCQLKRVSVN